MGKAFAACFESKFGTEFHGKMTNKVICTDINRFEHERGQNGE